MISLIFSVPIVIADISARKIPNIYLFLYAYISTIAVIFHGLPSTPTMVAMLVFLAVLNQLGMGMGDCKLIFLLSILIGISSPSHFLFLLTLIFLAGVFQILTQFWLCARFPRTLAMAPAIFIGTGLYLATS